MPGAHRCAPAQARRRAGSLCRAVHRAWSASASPVGQRQRVHRYRGPEMARSGRCEDALHRTRLAVGEPLKRELQWLASRRTAQRRDLLQPRRGQSADRGVAPSLQHRPSPQQPRLPTAGSGSGDTAIALTINPDHPTGAAHQPAGVLRPAFVIPILRVVAHGYASE